MNLQEAIPVYLDGKRKLSPKSRETYRFVLNLFSLDSKNKLVSELSHTDLRAFIAHMEKESKANATINLAVSAIIGFFEWASFERLWNGNIADIHYVADQGRTRIIEAA